MKLNRLLEITNDLERCGLCLIVGCECCDTERITANDLRKYYREIRKVLTENANLHEKLEQKYIDGAKYEIMKESDIPGSQAIRDSGGTIDMMCAAVADKIRAALEDE